MAIHELQQVLWLDTPKGTALAKFMIDRGIDSDLEWVTIVNETGEIWSFDNSDVKACKNLTLNRRCEWNQTECLPASQKSAMTKIRGQK